MNFTQHLREIEMRLEAATPGPWFIDGAEVRADGSPDTTNSGVADCTFKICEVPRLTEKLDGFASDREFIAHAPTDINRLLSALRLAVERHKLSTELSEHAARQVYEQTLEELAEILNGGSE